MNRPESYRRLILRSGYECKNLTTGETFYGLRPVAEMQGDRHEHAVLKVSSDINLSPGDILDLTGPDETATPYLAIVASIDYVDGLQTAILRRYWLQCRIYRTSDQKGITGHPVSSDLIAENIPFFVDYDDSNDGVAGVPVSVDIKQGDMIIVQKLMEVFKVQAIASNADAGIQKLIVARQKMK